MASTGAVVFASAGSVSFRSGEKTTHAATSLRPAAKSTACVPPQPKPTSPPPRPPPPPCDFTKVNAPTTCGITAAAAVAVTAFCTSASTLRKLATPPCGDSRSGATTASRRSQISHAAGTGSQPREVVQHHQAGMGALAFGCDR
jgi:hypothetical protein